MPSHLKKRRSRKRRSLFFRELPGINRFPFSASFCHWFWAVTRIHRLFSLGSPFLPREIDPPLLRVLTPDDFLSVSYHYAFSTNAPSFPKEISRIGRLCPVRPEKFLEILCPAQSFLTIVGLWSSFSFPVVGGPPSSATFIYLLFFQFALWASVCVLAPLCFLPPNPWCC